MKSIWMLLLLSPAFALAQAKRLHVSAIAPAGGDGSGWATAFQSLHDGLKAAETGDSVWVAAGTYHPDTIAGNRDLYFELNSGVKLFGGFLGTELVLSQRDWKKNETILSGDIGVIGDSTDNSYTLLYAVNTDSSTLIDGFIFERANADNANLNVPSRSRSKSGGGLYLDGQNGWAYVDVKNCVFRNNYAYSFGAGVYVNGTGTGSVAPRFLNCSFLNNHARLDGAGIYRDGGSWAERTPDFYGCYFYRNVAERRGAALYFQNSERLDQIEFIKLDFVENVGINGILGANLPRMENARTVLDSCTFVSNSGFSGILELRPLATFNPVKSIKLSNSSFIRNQAGDILILFMVNDVGNKINCDQLFFQENIGGGILDTESDSTFINSLLSVSDSMNHSFSIGSPSSICIAENMEIYNHHSGFSLFASYGDVIYKNILIHNSRFQGEPQGFFNYYDDNTRVQFHNFTISKCNLISNNAPQPLNKDTLVNFYNSTFDIDLEQLANFNKTRLRFYNCHFAQTPVSNFPTTAVLQNCFTNPDAMFVEPDSGDFHLLPCSPLINAGTNAPLAAISLEKDIDGAPRIQDSIVDIGIYESSQLSGNLTALGPVCHQDSTGKIQFSLPNGCLPAQLSWSKNDGQIGSDSLGLLAGVYAVTLTDGRGKTISDTLQILGSSPAVEVSGDSINCLGLSPAELFSTVSGGVDPLFFLWNSGQNDSKINDLGGGTYILTVTDALGCTAVDSAKVIETPMLGTSLAIVEASWIGGSNGAATVDVFAGLAPFSLLWSTGDTTKTISGLAPGDYFLTVTDGAGCEEIYPFTISFGTATDEVSEVQMHFSPNPASDFVQIELLNGSITERAELHFSNVLGETIFQTNFSSGRATVQTADWPNGLYLAQLFENGILKKTTRLIVAH